MSDETYKTVVYEERVMSNTEPQPPPYSPQSPYRQLPQSTVQLAHMTSDAVVSGLSKSPYLLGVVVLVSIGVGAAVYFLNILIQGQQAHLKSLLEVQSRQQTELVNLHKQEFDALLEMANRLSPVQSPIAPGSPGLNPIPPAQPPRGR